MNTKEILTHLAGTEAAQRKLLQKHARAHAEAQCNGDYWQNDDGKWEGVNAKSGTRREGEIIRDLRGLCGTLNVPEFIGFSGDPRGLVVKIFADKLTKEEKELCREFGFIKDWGGDFGIIKSIEVT